MKLRKSKEFRYIPDALEHSIETFMTGRDGSLQGSCISNTVYQLHFLMPALDSGELMESAETPHRHVLRTETRIHVDVKLFTFSLLGGNERVKTDVTSTRGSLPPSIPPQRLHVQSPARRLVVRQFASLKLLCI